MLLTAAVLGAGIGVVLGLTGAGGGMLAVPALMLTLGYSLADARPVSLIAVGLAALLGCLDGLRRGIVRYRAALWIAIIGVACAPLGPHLARLLPAALSGALFGLLMLWVAGRMLCATRAAHAEEEKPCDCHLDPATGRLRWTRRCASWLAAVGGAAGMLTGMFGVGGGFVIVPGLRRVSDVGMHASVATSLMVIALVSGISALTIVAQHGVTTDGWWFIAAAASGTLLGRMMQPNISAVLVQRMFAMLMVITSAILLVHSLW